jgi:hypothetical protein
MTTRVIPLALLLLAGSVAAADEAQVNLGKAKQAVRCSVVLSIAADSLPEQEKQQSAVFSQLLLLTAVGWGADPNQFKDWGHEVFDLAADADSGEKWKEEQLLCATFVKDNTSEIARIGSAALSEGEE